MRRKLKSSSSQSGISVLIGKPNEFITISIDIDPNYTITPFLNPLVRQAINYAINRSAIVPVHRLVMRSQLWDRFRPLFRMRGTLVSRFIRSMAT